MNVRAFIQRRRITAVLIVVWIVGVAASNLSALGTTDSIIQSPYRIRCGLCGPSPVRFVVTESSGVRRLLLCDRGELYSGELIAYLTVDDTLCRTGWLAPTSERTRIKMYFDPVVGPPAWGQKSEQESAALLAEWCEERGEFVAASMLRSGITTDSRPLLAGYLLTLIWSCVAMLAVYSMGWIGRSCRHRRGAIRLARGLCPSCAYPFAGLPSPVCPECGEVRCESETTPR